MIEHNTLADSATRDPAANDPASIGVQASGSTAPVTNPATRFTSDPFPEQRQDWPGLQRDMQPVPDCGEAWYVGTGRLNGRKALVTGGDSGIGRAAVIAFAREGAAVAINYHPREEPDAQDVKRLLESEGAEIVLLPGDLTDEAFCNELIADAVRCLDGLDILVNNAAYQQSKPPSPKSRRSNSTGR